MCDDFETAVDQVVRHLDECDAWLAWRADGEPEGLQPWGQDPAAPGYDAGQRSLVVETLRLAWATGSGDNTHMVRALLRDWCCHCTYCAERFPGHLPNCNVREVSHR